MKKEDLCNTLGEIKDDYIEEAREKMNTNTNKKSKRNFPYKIVGLVAAASICIVGYKIISTQNQNIDKPNPTNVQIKNPLKEVSSLEALEKEVGFSVPVLDKEISSYIVVNYDDNSKLARIEYSDGSTFNMMRGTGDVSGIYGGELDKQVAVDKAEDSYTISYYTFEDINYSIWEMNGFTFSLSKNKNTENSSEGQNIENETNDIISKLEQ